MPNDNRVYEAVSAKKGASGLIHCDASQNLLMMLARQTKKSVVIKIYFGGVQWQGDTQAK